MKRKIAPSDWIAETSFKLRRDAKVTKIHVKIGRPYKTRSSDWATPVELIGFGGRLSDIIGNDAVQSLSLAISFVHSLLQTFRENRWVNMTEKQIDTLFGRLPPDA